MPRKKKGRLPSGNIRIQRIVGTDELGKPIRKSFTASSRDEAELLWRQYMLLPQKSRDRSLGLSEAVKRYIDTKRSVLSPSTIRTYQGIIRTHLEGFQIGDMDINEIETQHLQIWISDLAADHSPKTVRNASALVRSSIEMFRPDFKYKVTLPQPKKADLYCPSDDDVRKLLNSIKDKELRIAVLLAAFGPLRRSEICALTSDDIEGNTITIRKAVVADEIGEWVTKGTKTTSSTRRIQMPPFVMEELKGIKGPIITCNPGALSARFKRAMKTSGCRRFRFHDLRHYSASIMHVIGISDKVIQQRGGWSTDSCLRRVYINVIDIEAERQNRKINEHFSSMAKSHV